MLYVEHQRKASWYFSENFKGLYLLYSATLYTFHRDWLLRYNTQVTRHLDITEYSRHEVEKYWGKDYIYTKLLHLID